MLNFLWKKKKELPLFRCMTMWSSIDFVNAQISWILSHCLKYKYLCTSGTNVFSLWRFAYKELEVVE